LHHRIGCASDADELFLQKMPMPMKCFHTKEKENFIAMGNIPFEYDVPYHSA
jgi:hypothetical protein